MNKKHIKNEEMIIPIYHDDKVEKIKLYFDNMIEEKSEPYSESILEIEINPKLKIFLDVDSDAYIYKQNGQLKLGNVLSINHINYSGHDLEIL